MKAHDPARLVRSEGPGFVRYTVAPARLNAVRWTMPLAAAPMLFALVALWFFPGRKHPPEGAGLAFITLLILAYLALIAGAWLYNERGLETLTLFDDGTFEVRRELNGFAWHDSYPLSEVKLCRYVEQEGPKGGGSFVKIERARKKLRFGKGLLEHESQPLVDELRARVAQANALRGEARPAPEELGRRAEPQPGQLPIVQLGADVPSGAGAAGQTATGPAAESAPQASTPHPPGHVRS